MVINYKIVGSTVSATVLFLTLFWCAQSNSIAPGEKDFVLYISVMVVGITMGWVIGILASPYGEEEKEHFSTIVKGVTIFFFRIRTGKNRSNNNSSSQARCIFRPNSGV